LSTKQTKKAPAEVKALDGDDDLDAALADLSTSAPISSPSASASLKLGATTEKSSASKKQEDEEREETEEEEPVSKGSQKPDKEEDPDPTWSKSKFSKATSISSDQYFQRNEYSETAPDHKEKLAKFSSATSISSDQFFDRQEEEEPDFGITLSDTGRKIGEVASNIFQGLKSWSSSQ